MSEILPGILVVGNDWRAPVPQAKSDSSYDQNGERLTVYYRDVWKGALWKSRLPLIGQAYYERPYLNFSSAIARQIEPGFLCDVEVTFQQNVGDGPPPSTEVTENGSTIKESITHHPKFNDEANNWKRWWNPQTNQFDPNYLMVPYAPATMPDFLNGVTDYEVGSSSITVTDYFQFDPGNIDSFLGRISAPPGGNSSGNYLCLSGSKGRSGQWYTRSLIYQFASVAWPPEIYSS